MRLHGYKDSGSLLHQPKYRSYCTAQCQQVNYDIQLSENTRPVMSMSCRKWVNHGAHGIEERRQNCQKCSTQTNEYSLSKVLANQPKDEQYGKCGEHDAVKDDKENQPAVADAPIAFRMFFLTGLVFCLWWVISKIVASLNDKCKSNMVVIFLIYAKNLYLSLVIRLLATNVSCTLIYGYYSCVLV